MDNKKIAADDIRRHNRAQIYRLLWSSNGLTRNDLQSALELSRPTVDLNLAELARRGLIREAQLVGNTGGRRARAFCAVPDARTAIGLDISREQIRAAVVDLKGRIIYRKQLSCAFRREDACFRQLGRLVEDLVAEAGLTRPYILGVGIGLPCLLSPDRETVASGELLKLTGAARSELVKYIRLPTAMFNDASAAGFAEVWAHPELQNAVYLMLSATVGGAVYLNGRQYGGETARAGEIGHITIVPDGKLCYCGRRGCVDAYCASGVLSGAAGGNLDAFFRRLDAGDPDIRAVWDRYTDLLALTVNNLRMLLDCPVILGGHVGGRLDPYFDEIRAKCAGRGSFSEDAGYLLPCRYKTDAVAAGAGLRFVEGFLETV